MTDFIETEYFETIMGALVLLIVLLAAWQMGPLRIIGEIFAHLAMNVLFLVVIVALGAFFMTDVGQALGGLYSWFVVILGAPVLILVGGLLTGVCSRWRRGGDDTGDGSDD